jgi:carboxyl-terminal processing protease
MRLTTARYYTPSGRSIQAKGIDPDIFVEQARIEPLETAGRSREADLRGALTAGEEGLAPGGAAAEPEGEREGAEETEVTVDYQLARALDLLRGISLFRARTGN